MSYKKVGKKKYLPIFSETNYAFQIDLTFFPKYKKQNKNYYILFTAINVNTRYAYAFYCKDKEATTILNLFKELNEKTVVNTITCDEGSEFNNKIFKDYCNENDIIIYFVIDDHHKMGINDRFHRTIKEKLTKYFSSSDKVNWVDVIDKIIYNYNHTVNRGVGIEPYKINNELEHEIILWKKSMTEILNEKENIFNVGDKVRILNKKVMFEDKMLSKYSSILFTVIKVLRNSCILNNNIEVKNSQLLKVNNVQNNKELVEIPKIIKENKIQNKINREKLDEVVLDRPKRLIKKINKLDL